mgnify:CR=1 FL=1
MENSDALIIEGVAPSADALRSAVERVERAYQGGPITLRAQGLPDPPAIPPPPIIPGPTPAERLSAFIDGRAVFFIDGTQFRNAVAAVGKLNELGRLMADASNARLRIAGHAAPGDAAAKDASKLRADVIRDALVDRG